MSTISSAPGPRRAFRIAGALVGLAAVFLVAGMALTHVDAGFLRARMEAETLRATGRALAIRGPIHLILWPAPGFVAADVALANIAGGSRPAMVHAVEVQATLDLEALLGQRLVVRSLVLREPDILVERTADGRPNWVFTPQAPPAPARQPGEVLPPPPPFASPPFAHVRLTISSIDLEGGRLAWRDLPRLGAGEFAIRHATAQQQQASSSFTVFLAGQHAATPFSLSLASGPPQALERADAAHPFPLRASLSIGAGDEPDQISVDGQFADPLHGCCFAGLVRARLRALADLDTLFPHAGLPAADAVRLDARVAEAPAGWALTELRAETGQADAARLLPGLAIAHLSVAAPRADAPIVLQATGTLRGRPFTIDGRAVGSLLAWTPGAAPAAAPVEVAASLGAARASLRGTVARAADAATRLDADARLALPDPGAVAAAFGQPFDRHVAVETDGHLAATRDAAGDFAASLTAAHLALGGAAMPPSRFALDRDAGGDTLRVTASLAAQATPWLTWSENASHQPPDFTAVFAGHLVPSALVTGLLGVGGHAISGPLDLAGTLHGAALGGRIDPTQLDGTLAATLVGGTISGALLAPALTATHLPLDGEVRVRCAGFSGHVAGGVVTLASLSLDSRLLAIDGDGTVTLPAGTLALHLRPVVRLGLAAASAPVLVGGTVAAPLAALAHDEQGRVALSFGRGAPAGAACDADPDVAALPAPKPPKPADILRSLGLFR